jgi:hypothetical protein
MSTASKESGGYPVLVLGMHRSATSLLAELFHRSGICMGNDLLPTRGGNPRGVYESQAIVEWHEWLLARQQGDEPSICGMSWLRRSPPEQADWELASSEGKRPIPDLSRPGPWGWKDPRTLLFLEKWMERYPHLRGIILYRHPADVYVSFLRRGDWAVALDPLLAFDAWSLHYEGVLNTIRHNPCRFLCVRADALLANWGEEVRRIADWLGLDLDGEAFKPEADAFHSQNPDSGAVKGLALISPEAEVLFQELERFRNTSGKGAGLSEWEVTPETRERLTDSELCRYQALFSADFSCEDGFNPHERRISLLREVGFALDEVGKGHSLFEAKEAFYNKRIQNLETSLRICREQMGFLMEGDTFKDLELRNLLVLRERLYKTERSAWRARKTIMELKGTWSWRITRPLRTLRKFLPCRQDGEP